MSGHESQFTSALVRARKFQAREDGTFTVFSLFVFMAMLMMAGLAVDVMRNEAIRVKMQGVTDRAVLAATMLGDNNGHVTPTELLESYFTAAGLRDQLGNNFEVTESQWTGRNVRAQPGAEVPTLFSRMIGFNNLPVVTHAAAAESVNSVWLDVVLVLDVSGSMALSSQGNGTPRIDLLRSAATQFAQQLLAENTDGKVSLTIVPYDTWVLPPDGMLGHFTNVGGNPAHPCADFSAYHNIENSRTASLTRANCDPAEWGKIKPYLNNAATAVPAINALQPRGMTAIDLGIRWGAAMLDPTLRPAITQMVDNGQIPSQYRGRPFDWDEPNVERAVVIMTDGKPESQRFGGNDANGTNWSVFSNALQSCYALRNRDVMVYTIALDAPWEGAWLMQNCASSPSHYYNSQIGGLLHIFDAIANQVVTQTLRLTE
jgi:hypothetical protein